MSELEPITREEQYLNAIAGGSNEVPEPITREEKFLKAILENGGGGGLPVVTQQDDGKVLKVENGQWKAGSNAPLIEVSYANLVELRNNGKLIAGMQYRITNYETIITGSYNLSALGAEGYIHYARSTEESWFDIIVTADDESHLNENARAARSDGADYAPDAKPEAWEIKYCLDNDTSRFAWADAIHGKGVIYYMRDEHNNSAGYDFKSIQFLRYALKLADATADYTPTDIGHAYDASGNPFRFGTPRDVAMALSAYSRSGNYVNPFALKYKDNDANNYDFSVGYNILGTVQFPEADDTYLSTFNADFYYTFDFFDVDGNHRDLSSEVINAFPIAKNNQIPTCIDLVATMVDESSQLGGLPNIVFEAHNAYDARTESNVIGYDSQYITFGSRCYCNQLGSRCYGGMYYSARGNRIGNDCSGVFGILRSTTIGNESSDLFIEQLEEGVIGCSCQYFTVIGSTALGWDVESHIRLITITSLTISSNAGEVLIRAYWGGDASATVINRTGYNTETAVSTTDGGATWA